MGYQPWMFAAMEEYGYTDTSEGLINRVAHYLAQEVAGEIDPETFEQACFACGVDPGSFTDEDFAYLRKRLRQI